MKKLISIPGLLIMAIVFFGFALLDSVMNDAQSFMDLSFIGQTFTVLFSLSFVALIVRTLLAMR